MPVPSRRMILAAALLSAAFTGGCIQPLYGDGNYSVGHVLLK